MPFDFKRNMPGGSRGPTNTLAPAINAAAVIDPLQPLSVTQGTWTGSPTLTYQWQRYNGSAWVDIGTPLSYALSARAPVDADFGLLLRVGEIPNGITAKTVYSNATNLVREAPAQTLSAERLGNGAFDSDTVWSKGIGWAIGSGVASKAAGSSTNLTQSSVVAAGERAEVRFDVLNYAGGYVLPIIGDASGVARIANGNYIDMVVSASTSFRFNGDSAFGGSVDNASLKIVTMNIQLTAPSVNMQLDQFYTLPGSPKIGSFLRLLPRISDFSAGNNWRVELIYTGAQWNITLYSVASGAATSRISATNIGTTNGIRVNMNGDSISLYTTANGGTNWTQRGTTITNSLYNTATGVNALWTSDFTPGNLVYAAAS